MDPVIKGTPAAATATATVESMETKYTHTNPSIISTFHTTMGPVIKGTSTAEQKEIETTSAATATATVESMDTKYTHTNPSIISTFHTTMGPVIKGTSTAEQKEIETTSAAPATATVESMEMKYTHTNPSIISIFHTTMDPVIKGTSTAEQKEIETTSAAAATATVESMEMKYTHKNPSIISTFPTTMDPVIKGTSAAEQKEIETTSAAAATATVESTENWRSMQSPWRTGEACRLKGNQPQRTSDAEYTESRETTEWPANSIFLAPAHIKSGRKLQFEPKLVSIGPYHHGQIQLQHMEDLKLQCTPKILKKQIINSFHPRPSEAVLPRCSLSIYTVRSSRQREMGEMGEMGIDDVPTEPFMKLEGRARAYYKHHVQHEPIEFVRMLVLDSLFFIRTVFALFQPVQESTDFLDGHIKDVRSDLLMLENQIPLFFIRKVYKWLVPHANHPQVLPFETVLKPFICLDIPWRINHVGKEAAHFLDLYWRCSLPPWIYRELFERDLKDVRQNRGYLSELVQRLHLERYLFVQIRGYLSELKQRYHYELERNISDQIEYRPDSSSEPEIHLSSEEETTFAKTHLSNNAPMVIANATELQKMAGIEFEKFKDKCHLDVVFSNGIMRMPRLKIDKRQTILLRNLIAYENCILPTWRFFTSYMKLMDALVDSENDVKLLQKCGIIYNTLNSHEKAATFFNDIGNYCFIDDNANCFSHLYKDVQKYYNSRWHCRWASLRHNYFSSPWAGISVIAGVILLILSVLQTFYSVYGYYKPNN